MIKSPLRLKTPSDPIDKIHALAHDLAYGAATRQFSAILCVDDKGQTYPLNQKPNYQKTIGEKWGGIFEYIDLLISFGYLSKVEKERYLLTLKAFELLEKPALPPVVFISYEHERSSAFALFIESKLESRGVHVFLDRSLIVGSVWEDSLEEKIKESRYFICLLAPKSIESGAIKKEIKLAIKNAKIIIPIWHSGFSSTILTEEYQQLNTPHALKVLEESAKAYYDVVEELLNQLGYSTSLKAFGTIYIEK